MQEPISNIENNEISWTEEEIKKWFESGLIHEDLLSPLRFHDLVQFIAKNKNELYKCFKTNPVENRYQVTIPPKEEWDQTYELQVIDKRTGEVVKILEKFAPFDLCEGISLKVKAKELKEWEKETAAIKNLNKEQHETFKSALEQVGKEKELTRKEIVTLIEEIRKPRKSKKVRQAGHFADCKLQYNYPQDHQPSLFDLLSPTAKEKLETSSTEIKAIGIKLTPSEDKLINAIYKLLQDKSENHDEKSELFYGGNEPGQIIPYGTHNGKQQEARSVFLRVKPAELYKEYLGDDNYSGKDIANIKSVLYGISEKKFLIIYDRKRKVKNGNKTENRTDRIEEFQNLIKIVSYIEDMTDKEVDSLEKGESTVREQKGELIIALNPLLTDQINSKYIEYPTDINKRTMIASGGHLHVTESINSLRDYMLREISNKRYKCEINADRLPYVLKLENYVKSHRKKLINERINGAIKSVRNLGIIINHEIQHGALGQPKYVFFLNPDFE